MVNGVFQVQDSIFDGIADVILRIRSGGGDLFIGTAFRKLLVLQERWTWIISNVRGKQKHLKKKCRCLLTLMRIFFLSWFGDGSPSAAISTGFVSNMSPNTFLKWVAMFLCWTMLQWSSMDKMTGKLWRRRDLFHLCFYHVILLSFFFFFSLSRMGRLPLSRSGH